MAFGGVRSKLWNPTPPLAPGLSHTQAHKPRANAPGRRFSGFRRTIRPWQNTCHFGAPYSCCFLFPGTTTPVEGYLASGRLTAHCDKKLKTGFSGSSQMHLNPRWCLKAPHLTRSRGLAPMKDNSGKFLVLLRFRACHYSPAGSILPGTIRKWRAFGHRPRVAY